MQINPEDMDRDALLQFFATYTLDKCLASGIAHYIPIHEIKDRRVRERAAATPRPKRLLTREEERLVEEAMSKGLMVFENQEFEAAIVYVSAAFFIELDRKRFMEALPAGGAA